MAKPSEDPPSPVDAYEAPAAAPIAPPAYQQAAYSPVGYGAPVRRTNVLAIVSLILSCAGLIFWFLLPIGGVVTGHIALAQIKRTGESGHGMALAGVIVGYALIALSIIGILLYVLFFVFLIGAANSAGNFNFSNFG
jgi:Domain of unknown function (DUF4190)